MAAKKEKNDPRPEPKKAEVFNPVIPQVEGLKCQLCGKPVAPGQNQVCKDHVRIN